MKKELMGNSFLASARAVLLGAGVAALVTVATGGVLFSMVTPIGWAIAGGLCLYLIGSGIRLYWDSYKAGQKRDMYNKRKEFFSDYSRNTMDKAGRSESLWSSSHTVSFLDTKVGLSLTEKRDLFLLENDPIYLSEAILQECQEEKMGNAPPFWTTILKDLGIENPESQLFDYICSGILS